MSFSFEIKQESFAKLLGRLQGLLERRYNMPILSHIKFEVKADGVIGLTANNMEITIADDMPCSSQGSGAVIVPGQLLYNWVSHLPSDKDIRVSVEEKDKEDWRFVLTCGGSRSEFRSLDSSTYPPLTQEGEFSEIIFTAAQFNLLLHRVDYAMPKDSSRLAFNGVYFHKETEGNVFKAVATDSHRLAVASIELESANSLSSGVLLPTRAVVELKKLLEGYEGEIKMRIYENEMVVLFDAVCFKARLLDANFPDYKKVFPQDEGSRITVSADVLADVVQRISVISEHERKRVILSAENNLLTLQSQSGEFHEASDELKISFTGETVRVGYNARYILDAISVLKGSDVTLTIRKNNTATTISSDEHPDYTALVMPERI